VLAFADLLHQPLTKQGVILRSNNAKLVRDPRPLVFPLNRSKIVLEASQVVQDGVVVRLLMKQKIDTLLIGEILSLVWRDNLARSSHTVPQFSVLSVEQPPNVPATLLPIALQPKV
jgi:hypothetical protein